MPPSTFCLEEAFRAAEWTMVRRKKKQGSNSRSIRWGSSAVAMAKGAASGYLCGRRSPAQAPAEIITACSKFSDHVISGSISFLNFDEPKGNKAQSPFVVSSRTRHKGQVDDYPNHKIKGTRPNFFVTSRVLGLRNNRNRDSRHSSIGITPPGRLFAPAIMAG
jgi:hypothetical protein